MAIYKSEGKTIELKDKIKVKDLKAFQELLGDESQERLKQGANPTIDDMVNIIWFFVVNKEELTKEDIGDLDIPVFNEMSVHVGGMVNPGKKNVSSKK